MKRVFAAASLAFLAAPALSQQAPKLAETDLGRNYKGLPYVYDLVERLQVQPQFRVVDPEKQARAKVCEERMMRELRRSGLAERGQGRLPFLRRKARRA